jgi:hypothetical protein
VEREAEALGDLLDQGQRPSGVGRCVDVVRQARSEADDRDALGLEPRSEDSDDSGRPLIVGGADCEIRESRNMALS